MLMLASWPSRLLGFLRNVVGSVDDPGSEVTDGGGVLHQGLRCGDFRLHGNAVWKNPSSWLLLFFARFLCRPLQLKAEEPFSALNSGSFSIPLSEGAFRCFAPTSLHHRRPSAVIWPSQQDTGGLPVPRSAIFS